MANEVKAQGKDALTPKRLRYLKRQGFADSDLARLAGCGESEIRSRRRAASIAPAFKRIDTCAAEFESFTPYLYSSYDQECEAAPTKNKKVVILGSGPNRIGQGIEFDYCCCHAAFALRDAGYETVMVNCNPETVSTDYDSVDRLFFEPLTFEDVMSILDTERSAGAEVSVVVQFGGQTPLKLALPLQEAGVKIIGTSPDSIDLAEDRERFSALLNELQIPQPQNGMAVSKDEALEVARGIGYPVVVRPSYVLGGRAMAIVYDAGRARALHGQRRRRLARAADPDRPLPRGRLRARRRRARRRRGPRRHRRRDGAHRGGRHPLGRQLVRRPDLPRRRASTCRRSATTRAASRGRSRSSA